MPRHDTISWGNAVIFLPENQIQHIESILNGIDQQTENQLRQNCIEIFDKICGIDGANLDKVIKMEFQSYSQLVYDLEAQKLLDTNSRALLDIPDIQIRNLGIFTSHKNKLEMCPTNLKNNLNKWKSCNPTYRFEYYDDHEMRNWMMRHVTKQTFENFDSLNTGAGKADLFRICKLYHDGGVWVDADLPAFDITQQKSNFRQIIHKHHTVLIKNRKCNNPRYTIIASKKNGDLLYHQINAINDKISSAKQTNKQQTTIHVTGPFVLHELICLVQKIKNIDDLPIDTSFSIGETTYIYIDDIVPEKQTYQDENVYSGYAQDLNEMNVKPHSTIKSIK